jgi:hypothetical protein
VKISDRVENIFSHAVALHQCGRFRNTVYCIDDRVYILNFDRTVLLRFLTGEKPFAHPVSFEANDYDSSEVVEKDGRVEFILTDGAESPEYIRTKSCRTPKYTPEQVMDMFRRLGPPIGGMTVIPREVCKLLDDSLSHIEFSAREGQLTIVQRNIYTGTMIKVEHKPKGMPLFPVEIDHFGPLGMRTDDFMALYTFVDKVKFWFGGKDVVHVESDDLKLDMRGRVSMCVYDELGGEMQEDK